MSFNREVKHFFKTLLSSIFGAILIVTALVLCLTAFLSLINQ